MGVKTAHQDLAVAPAMTMAEALFSGRELRRPGCLASVLHRWDMEATLA